MRGVLKKISKLLITTMLITSIVNISMTKQVEAASNLITNNGLETGNTSGWTGYGGWTVTNSGAYSGSYCARVQPNSSFEQVINGLQPNTIYALKAKVKVENSSTKVRLGIKEFGGQETYTVVSTVQYSDAIINFRTGSTNTSARIYFHMDGTTTGYSYADNFELYPFEAPNTEYNVYFGGLHDHTSYSDGSLTPDEAYQYAKANSSADFMATTEHNTFGIARQLSDGEWEDSRNSANRNNVYNSFVGIAGFEMTTNTWGHANVFNTESYFPWEKSLSDFYNSISPEAIGQFNHPGWDDMNLFENFNYLTQKNDNVMELLEVGNGRGPLDHSGDYDWYYGSYITALDKGWHIAPTNNQDNHKPTWLSDMPTRTAVLAYSLDRAHIIDAIKNKRVYSTEDENLKIIYRLNGQIMGSILNSPQQLNFAINVQNPEANVKIKEIRIVADGGRVVETKNCTSNVESWNVTLPAQYSYYFLYVILDDKSIAVTAPIWTGLPNVSRTPQITLQSIPTTSNETFVVNMSNFRPPQPTDWIGLYEESETPDGSPRSIWFSYLQDLRIDDSGNGSFIFNPSSIPDAERLRYQPNRSYKFVYCQNNKFDILASAPFYINSSTVSSGTNLALNKTVTASTYYDNDPNLAPNKVVDGNTNTLWNAGRDTSGGQWIEINFGSPITFNKVVTKANLDRITGYKLQYWNGSQYVDILNGARVFPLRADVFEPVTSQKLRMYIISTKTDQNGWGQSARIDELEVYNDTNAPISMQNYALNKQALASSNWDNDTTRPSKVCDGSLASAWNAARGTSAGQWIEIDMGKQTTFNTIELIAYLERITDYKVQYWNGASWSDIVLGGYITPNKVIRFADITAQKVRVFINATKLDQNEWGADPEIDEIFIYRR